MRDIYVEELKIIRKSHDEAMRRAMSAIAIISTACLVAIILLSVSDDIKERAISHDYFTTDYDYVTDDINNTNENNITVGGVE